MRLLIALFLLLIVTLLFEYFPSTGDRGWWPFFDGYTLTPQWYVKQHEEFIYRCTLLFALAFEVRKYRDEILFFALLNVADWIDFVFTNNTTWFHVGIFPISMNVLFIIIFGFIIFMAWLRNRELN